MKLFTFRLFHANVKSNLAWRQFRIVIGNYYRKNHLFNWRNKRNRNFIGKAMNPQKVIIINADVGDIIFPSTSRANHAYGLAFFKRAGESFVFLKSCVCQFKSASRICDLFLKEGI